MRNDYTLGRLREEDLAATWVEQFDRWFADVVAAEIPEPNAVVVATADADGAPDGRLVLMKGYDEGGVVFGTSYASAKGAQLAAAASVQSTVVDSREELADRVRLLDEETSPGPVPRPAIWGGYRVIPDRVEFWQGGRDRLHDRLRFVRDDGEGGGWIVRRLAP